MVNTDLISTTALYGDYLAHWRTKGSKNGQRLYQYEDGTYTELGKERRRKGFRERYEERKARRAEKRQMRAVRKAIMNPQKGFKKRDKFTDEEIQRIVDRIKLDGKFKDVAMPTLTSGLDAYKKANEFIETSVKLGKNLSNMYDVGVGVYNTMVKAGKIKGKELPRIEDAFKKDDDRSVIERVVSGGSAEDVRAYASKMTPNELKNAFARLNTEQKLDEMINKGSKNTTSQSQQQSSQSSGQSQQQSSPSSDGKAPRNVNTSNSNNTTNNVSNSMGSNNTNNITIDSFTDLFKSKGMAKGVSTFDVMRFMAEPILDIPDPPSQDEKKDK